MIRFCTGSAYLYYGGPMDTLLLIDGMPHLPSAGSISECAELRSVQHETFTVQSRLCGDDCTRRRLTIINESSVPDRQGHR
jgi:hypothetical protein